LRQFGRSEEIRNEKNIITPVLPVLRGQLGQEFIGKSINHRIGKLSIKSNVLSWAGFG
jgi:hypothetical protein